jgi:hypothetical protein
MFSSNMQYDAKFTCFFKTGTITPDADHYRSGEIVQ